MNGATSLMLLRPGAPADRRAAVARRGSFAVIGALACALAGGCTYGPVEDRARIRDQLVRPETHQFAVALSYARVRPATGFLTYVDKNAATTVAEWVVIWLADVEEGSFLELARIAPPNELRAAFDVALAGWRGERLFFTLTGCPGPECYGGLIRRRHYAVSPGGPVEEIEEVPEDLERPPGMVARAPGENVYLRVSAGADSVEVRTEDDAPFRPFCRTGRGGTLVLDKPAPFSSGGGSVSRGVPNG